MKEPLEVKKQINNKLNEEMNQSFMSSASNSNIRIYNLSASNRANIRKDAYDRNTLRELVFEAGYGNNLSMLCVGQINQAFSIREGVNYVTEIETYDGGFAYLGSESNVHYPAGTPYRTIIIDLIKSLKPQGVSLGAVGDIQGTCGRGFSAKGSTVDVLRELTGGKFFIDNGFGNVLDNSEYINGTTLLINSESGLIGTPKRRETFIDLTMIFEPSVYVGQLVRLETLTGDKMNGNFIISSIQHQGTISSVVSGSATTTLGLTDEYGAIIPITQEAV